MKTPIRTFFANFARLEAFSPAGLAARAGLLAAVFALCEAAGLREYATFLSGTQHGGQWLSSVLGGVAYLLAYYGFVLAAPILLIAAGLLAAWRRLGRS